MRRVAQRVKRAVALLGSPKSFLPPRKRISLPHFLTFSLLVAALIGYWSLLPQPLFEEPLSTVVLDRNGQLLGARIASDGQWRFPESDRVPDKFAHALVEYEDRRFYRHPGVDPIAIGRAAYSDLKARRIVSGGSTLTMQLARRMRKQ
ncbi:MAG TPA: transglycosylase domain-containing protein, partial [Steroidobacteraceae bacterium]|nr:transglycosylase domain-containing protein [Steroidobacteraceae bacterium]